MSNLLLTLAIAFVVILIAIGLLAMDGRLQAGPEFKLGHAAGIPHKKREEQDGCGTKISCSLCEKPKEKK